MVGTIHRSRRLLTGLNRSVTDLLLPPRCARCDIDLPASQPFLLCRGCVELLTVGGDRFCRRCGNPRPSDPYDGQCLRCRTIKLRFNSVIPLGPYRGALRDAILTMKHPAGEPLSKAVGQLLASCRERPLCEFDADCIVPVPMFWRRRIWRGVNSPQVLAEELSRRIQVPLLPGVLSRDRNTLPQKDLGHTARFRNVRGAFTLCGGYGLEDARVLIVDDIMTTGATCNEVARTLKKGGVRAVSAVIVGRAGLPS